MVDGSHRRLDSAGTVGVPVFVRFTLYALFMVVCVASFIPGLRLWGIDHLAYFPTWLRVASLLAIGLSFIPRVAAGLHRAATKVATHWKRRRRFVGLMVVLGTLIAAAGLWLVRSSTELLGDGQMVARSFEVIFSNPTGVRLQSVWDILRLERLYPGAMTTYYGVAKMAAGLFGASPVTAIRGLNCALGGLVVLGLLFVARRKSVPADVVPWLCASVLLSGAMELFAGYVEFYPPMMFVAFLYVLAGFRCLGSGRGLALPVVLFAGTVFMHVQGILLGPSLLYLVWLRFLGRTRPRLYRRPFWSVLALTFVAVAAGGLVPSVRSHFLPLLANTGTGVLTPTHLLDLLNELLLVLPVLPVVMVMLWGKGRGADDDAKSPTHGKTSGSAVGPASYLSFAGLLLIPTLIYLFLFRTEIGVARDWDLFSMVALGLLPLSYLAVARFTRRLGAGEIAAPVLVPMIVLTVVLGGAWLGVNASWGRSSARFERLLAFDPTHSGYAMENLALLYHEKGDLARATEIMERTAKLSGNDRHVVRLARFYAEAGRFEEAEKLLRPVVDRAPQFVEARISLLQVFEADSTYAEMYDVAKAGTVVFPNFTAFWYYFGEAAAGLGRTVEAREAFEKVLSLKPTPDVEREVLLRLRELGPPLPD